MIAANSGIRISGAHSFPLISEPKPSRYFPIIYKFI
jgi:hypothetical protein